jgi:MORN repeat
MEKSGNNGIRGTWISLETAKAQAGGIEWWNNVSRDGCTIDPRQHDVMGPESKPVWFFENGDMYLGECTKKNNHRVKNGFGINYTAFPAEYEGMVYMGEFKNGLAHGKGESFWLADSAIWTKNQHPSSPIEQTGERRPYMYYGLRVNDVEHGKKATVVLKDGTTRIGEWRNGKPVGDWWKDHEDPTVSTARPPKRDSSKRPASRKKTPEQKAKRRQCAKIATHRARFYKLIGNYHALAMKHLVGNRLEAFQVQKAETESWIAAMRKTGPPTKAKVDAFENLVQRFPDQWKIAQENWKPGKALEKRIKLVTSPSKVDLASAEIATSFSTSMVDGENHRILDSSVGRHTQIERKKIVRKRDTKCSDDNGTRSSKGKRQKVDDGGDAARQTNNETSEQMLPAPEVTKIVKREQIEEKDDEEDEIEVWTGANSEETEKRKLVNQLQVWLTDTIGSSAPSYQMKQYATFLLEAGWHSAGFIQDHVDDFQQNLGDYKKEGHFKGPHTLALRAWCQNAKNQRPT